MKRILISLAIMVSALFGNSGPIDPKFESIKIEAPDILTALTKLETQAQEIYEQYDISPALKVFDLSSGTKQRIEYAGEGQSLSEVVVELLKLNKTEYYISDSGSIWIGVSEKTVKEIESKYPENLADVILPKIVFEDMSISEVEDVLGELWLIYNPYLESAKWRMNTGRSSERKLNFTCRHVDFLSVVTYLDVINKRESNQ